MKVVKATSASNAQLREMKTPTQTSNGTKP